LLGGGYRDLVLWGHSAPTEIILNRTHGSLNANESAGGKCRRGQLHRFLFQLNFFLLLYHFLSFLRKVGLSSYRALFIYLFLTLTYHFDLLFADGAKIDQYSVANGVPVGVPVARFLLRPWLDLNGLVFGLLLEFSLQGSLDNAATDGRVGARARPLIRGTRDES